MTREALTDRYPIGGAGGIAPTPNPTRPATTRGLQTLSVRLTSGVEPIFGGRKWLIRTTKWTKPYTTLGN